MDRHAPRPRRAGRPRSQRGAPEREHRIDVEGVDRTPPGPCWPGVRRRCPRAAASSEMRAGQGRVAVGEASGVVAGEAHVQAPVAEVEVGMVVGRLAASAISPMKATASGKDGATNQVSTPAAGCASRAGRGGGRTPRRRDAISHAVDRSQDLNTKRATGTGPPAARSGGGRPVAGPQDRADVPGSDLGVAGGDDGAHDRAHHLVAEGGRPRSRSAAPPPPGRSTRPGAPVAPATPARRPARPSGRRQNALKSCSPRNGSQARVSSSMSRGTGTCHAVRGHERVRHRPVQHGVAVGAAAWPRSEHRSRARRRRSRARRSPGPHSFTSERCSASRSTRSPAGRATRPGPTRARRGRCARRR